MNTKPQFHGSDLEKIESYYHVSRENIVGFGANVNPLGISPRIRNEVAQHLDAISRYPDRDYTKLRDAISQYTGANAEHIMVGNGCTELISLFLKTLHPEHTLILGPTYSEYERALRQIGASCDYYVLSQENDFRICIEDFCNTITEDTDLVVICNPNNPTSSAIKAEEMKILLEHCSKHHVFVLIDETYAEFAPLETPVSAITLTDAYENLMILRGTSKFFAAPGLRLGYGISKNQEILSTMKEKQDPWSTNSLAEVAGCVMFTDTDYIQKTRQLIHDEREKMISVLSSWNTVKVYPAMANFILVEILKPGLTSDMVFEHCIKKGLMIRDCSTFEGLHGEFFRFCIMLPEDNDRLLQTLEEILVSS